MVNVNQKINQRINNMKIDIYEAPFSTNLMATFTSKRAALRYIHNSPKTIYADQVAINDQVILSFDEF